MKFDDEKIKFTNDVHMIGGEKVQFWKKLVENVGNKFLDHITPEDYGYFWSEIYLELGKDYSGVRIFQVYSLGLKRGRENK